MDLNSLGYLKYRSKRISRITSSYHPLKVFEELDKLDLESLLKENRGLSIEVGFSAGGGTISGGYLLDNGSLRPLESIRFKESIHSIITIGVRTRGKIRKNDRISIETQTVMDIISREKNKEPDYPRVCFLREDLSKACLVSFK